MVCAENNTKLKEEDELIFKRKGGGSIIDQQPLFSKDGETLYVIWGHIIRAYSTGTGELIRDYEGLENRAVGVHFHPYRHRQLTSCSETGQVITWKWKAGVIQSKTQMVFGSETVRVSSFYLIALPNEECVVFLIWTDTTKPTARVKAGLFSLNNGSIITEITTRLKTGTHFVSHGGLPGEQFITIVQGKYMHNIAISQARSTVLKTHKIGSGRLFTCVSCHPELPLVLTGDNTGRAVLWASIFNNNVTQAVFHWHTLAVQCLAFTHSGSHFYSGGNENTLVKWDARDSQKRSFLPRLPAPICHVVVGPENNFVAVSTRDNAIQLVNAQNHLCGIIQHLTWNVQYTIEVDPLKGSHSTCSESPFPAGLIYDPVTGALVLNGRSGHIQFYSTHSKSLMYNVDITGQNQLTAERDVSIINTSVIRVAVGAVAGVTSTSWMATVEHRDDHVTHFESRLKFWEYNAKTQTFSLNTSVEMPHEGKVMCVEFQPISSSSNQSLLCATAGSDHSINIWSLEESNDLYRKGKSWLCIGSAQYKRLPVQSVNFSMDGSLLACGFGPCVTVWTPENLGLKCSLAQVGQSTNIRQVMFGKYKYGHLLVSCNSTHLTVWNVLTLRSMWTVNISIGTLTCDPFSTHIAAFTTDNKLFIFTPDNAHPVYNRTLTKLNYINGAVWIPHQRTNTTTKAQWQRHSQLYFLDDQQELLCLESRQEDEHLMGAVPAVSGTALTAFGSLVATHRTSEVIQNISKKHGAVGVPGSNSVKELLLQAPHAMPPLHVLCSSFLRALLGSSEPSEECSDDEEEDEMETIIVDSDDSDSEASARPRKPRHAREVTKNSRNVPNKVELIDVENTLDNVARTTNTWATLLINQ